MKEQQSIHPGKLLIFSAPSGSGKSTIIEYLMSKNLGLHFSISATSRPPRGKEQHGVEYFFLSTEEFKKHIEAGDFLEYEEVYEGRYYGTLREQVDRQLAAGENVVCDVDVLGGKNIKAVYGNRALAIFIQPPSIDELRKRLEGRATDAPEVITKRIERAAFELSFAKDFDKIVINDDLSTAQAETLNIVEAFLTKE
jgi:guanylate kinase